jgi:hypothetical protein
MKMRPMIGFLTNAVNDYQIIKRIGMDGMIWDIIVTSKISTII